MVIIKEGVIHVPDHLVNYIKEIVLDMVGNYLGQIFNEKYHRHFIVNGRSIVNNKSHLTIDVNDVEGIQGSMYHLDVRDVPYTDKSTDKVLIGVQLVNTNSMYVPSHNAIAISVKEPIEFINRISDYPTDDMEDLDAYYELVEIFKRINAMLGTFSNSLNGTIKHELAHFIQFQYLSKKHPKQSGVDDSYSEDDLHAYYQADIEQSPHVISAIEVFNHNAPLATVTPIEYFKYLVGMTDNGGKFTKNDTLPTNSVRNFFITLKNNNKSKYKKAVKYFASNI